MMRSVAFLIVALSGLGTWAIVADPASYKKCVIVLHDDESFEDHKCRRVGKHGMNCASMEFPEIAAAVCE